MKKITWRQLIYHTPHPKKVIESLTLDDSKRINNELLDYIQKWKYHDQPNFTKNWDKEYVSSLSTEKIIEWLEYFWIQFSEEEFIKIAKKYQDSEKIMEKWGEDVYEFEFINTACDVLWERLLPDVVSIDILCDMTNEGYELSVSRWSFDEEDELDDVDSDENDNKGVWVGQEGNNKEENSIKACEIWFKVWDWLKKNFIKKWMTKIDDIEDTSHWYHDYPFVQWWYDDFLVELEYLGQFDKQYYQKRLDLCNDFLDIFWDDIEDEFHSWILESKASSYYYLWEYDKWEEAYKKLIKLYPNDVWNYLHWWDRYGVFCSNEKIKDLKKAEKIYRMALNVKSDGMRNDKQDVLDRIEELKEL